MSPAAESIEPSRQTKKKYKSRTPTIGFSEEYATLDQSTPTIGQAPQPTSPRETPSPSFP